MNKLNILEIINKSVFSVEAQFHVLKHFISIDDEFYEKLLKTGYSKSDINNQIKLQRSKFNSIFCSNPIDLVDTLDNNYLKSEVKINPISLNVEMSFEFSKIDYPNGIGTDHLIHKKYLTEEQINNIRKKNIENTLINFTKGEALPTNKMNCIMELKENKYYIITIFPGKYAPPFPNKTTQNIGLFQVCKSFWDEHVFVEN